MQLIVLGMHRSGTSSVTRLLNLAGAYFGPEGSATDPNEENPKGFWERRDVREVCDGLLIGGGFEWWRVADFDVARIPDEVQEEHVDAFGQVVFQLDAHRPWVIKEPRLCLVLPLLRAQLEAPVFIHVTREPLEIAESLAARNGFPVPAGLALWEAYTVSSLAASAGEPRVQVSYGELMRDPVGTTTALIEQLTDLGVQGLRVPADQEILAFVSPSLHRQRQGVADRAEYLNAPQAALAVAADEQQMLAIDLPTTVSAGAAATLRAFEQNQALEVELEEQQAQAEADRAQTEADRAQAEAELAQAEVAHREIEDGLRATHLQVERGLQASAAQQAELVRMAEREAVESLVTAERKLRAVKTSGAVRLGARLSGVRERLRGRRTVGVDGALDKAMRHIDQARSVLEGQMEGDRGMAVGPGAEDPLPIEEMRSRRRTSRAQGERAKVAVLAWDVGHNPFGRAHLLADLLSDRFDVELWGSQFERYGSDVWAPLRNTRLPVRRIPGSSFPDFLESMDDAARRIDADVLYVSKPRLPSLGLGILAKELWNRPLIVDVDDFEPSFFDEDAGLGVAELLRRGGDPDATLPFGRIWTLACEAAVSAADVLTVSNGELEDRYGGTLVPHARDEAVFDPDRYDRDAARRRLGLRDDDRLVLFGGTPRAHKGIVELLEAAEHLGDARVKVGAFDGRELRELRKEIGPLERWLLPLPNQTFDELPALLVAADLTCALQAPDHPVSRYQMPAKVTDALAMGLPCLVTAVPPLQPLIDEDVVELFDGEQPLHHRLKQIFDDPEGTAERARRGREVFLKSYSYAAVRPAAEAAVERYLDDPPPAAPALTSLMSASREIFQPNRPRGRVVTRPSVPLGRRRIERGETYDLAVFWKQNDTGIYGRRQDMFLKYLERSGRFRKIVHFDQPMSAEGLLSVARRSIGTTDQNRLVLGQTLRRLAHRSDRGAVRQRTFLYSAGRASRALKLPSRAAYTDYVRSELRREGIGGRPLMCWVYPSNTFFPDIVDALRPDVVVADVVDDNRSWYAPGTPLYDQVERNYAAVLERSDVVLANCEPVAESMGGFAPRVDVIPNACELPDGRPRPPRPADLAGLGGPIIGYAGNLSDRIDIELLGELARARPDWSFVFLGSTHLDQSALTLAAEANVRFIGTKRYEEAQEIIRHFDVALIPHLDNEMTRSMNPLKAFVYCSLGVPIVSTPVANLDELAEFITIARGRDDFLAAIEAALAEGHRVPDAETLAPHSWEVRVAQVLDLVDDVVSSRPSDGHDPGPESAETLQR